MKKRKVVVSRRHIEDAKIRLKGKFSCSRCKSTFDTDELLQEHKLHQHGECKENDYLRDRKLITRPRRVKSIVDGSGKVWDRNYTPEFIKELNQESIGLPIEGCLAKLDCKRPCKNCNNTVYSTYRIKEDEPILCPICNCDIKRKRISNINIEEEDYGSKMSKLPSRLTE